LPEDDYSYLIQYVENVKNDISNDKMIILSGEGRTGKTTLKNNIQTYLGDEKCGDFMISGEIIYSENIKKIGPFCGIDDIYSSKKNNNAIINLIKYKQSFIADTIRIERVKSNLLEHSIIIKMTHVF
jgi:ABC-type dipeptide/oligopeptide/nickel transport system ATPase component